MWKLFIVEPFFLMKLTKIKNEICIGIWKHSWCCWKAIRVLNLIEFISEISKLRCGNIDFFIRFVVGNSNKLQKIGFEKKNQLSPQCVHTWANGLGYTSYIM